MTEREQERMAAWGSRPFRPSQWARRNLKPFSGLFIAMALVVLAFAATILWFFLS